MNALPIAGWLTILSTVTVAEDRKAVSEYLRDQH